MQGRPVLNIRHPDQARTFLDLPEEDRANCYGVFGHTPFGMHRHVERPVTYITFLRDPVDWALSAIRTTISCVRRTIPPRTRSESLASPGPRDPRICKLPRCRIHDFVQRPDAQGRFWWNSASPGRSRREALEQAKANLDRCDFIDFTEHYDGDLQALRHLRGHRIEVRNVAPHEQVGRNRLSQSDLTANNWMRSALAIAPIWNCMSTP